MVFRYGSPSTLIQNDVIRDYNTHDTMHNVLALLSACPVSKGLNLTDGMLVEVSTSPPPPRPAPGSCPVGSGEREQPPKKGQMFIALVLAQAAFLQPSGEGAPEHHKTQLPKEVSTAAASQRSTHQDKSGLSERESSKRGCLLEVRLAQRRLRQGSTPGD